MRLAKVLRFRLFYSIPTMKGSYGDPENTGVGYNTIIRNLGDHSVPTEWAEYVKKNEKKDAAPGAPIAWESPSQPEEVQPGYGFIPENESTEETFYYHSDHLGSTSYVTDDSARITQYTAYLPYGELLVDEHSSSEEMPYKFNGKEFDEETGLYYYGARYMQPITSIWYGIDPLTEKYPDVSAYVYCAGNPIIRIDTDGRDSYLIVWASQSDAYGHAAFAVDNYSWDAKQKTYLPNGTMTVYGLFPQEAYGANQAVSDERVQALFLIDKHATIEKIKTNKFNSGEISNPDGILKISTNYETDSQTKKVLQKEISSNKGYKGMSRNCSTFARVGVQNATRKDVKGTENCLFYNYVTPNSLFKETKELNNTTVIVDSGDKIDYKFITNINVSVKDAIK